MNIRKTSYKVLGLLFKIDAKCVILLFSDEETLAGHYK